MRSIGARLRDYAAIVVLVTNPVDVGDEPRDRSGTADLLRCILRSERRVLNVSRVQPPPHPWRGVALSMPTVVSAEGAVEVLEPDMSDAERAALVQSARVLDDAFKSLSDAGRAVPAG